MWLKATTLMFVILILAYALGIVPVFQQFFARILAIPEFRGEMGGFFQLVLHLIYLVAFLFLVQLLVGKGKK